MRSVRSVIWLLPVVVILNCLSCNSAIKNDAGQENVIFVYTLNDNGTSESYDEAMLVASLQGIMNRDKPAVYLVSGTNKRPAFWLDIFRSEGRWLNERKIQTIPDPDAFLKLASGRIKGAVIWDPAVPASMNVATTRAGVEDGIVLSPELAEKYLKKWNLPVIRDLRGMFAGDETGSAKNDAYRWAVRNYLSKGLCSGHLLCNFEDPYFTRSKGDVGYVVTRDRAIKDRSFVFDLSPWGDEVPKDDLSQKQGTDLETFNLILGEVLRQTEGKEMTEVEGFFSFPKYSNIPGYTSRHEPVPTEWETVYLISPYNCYQNTVASNCYNQSFHCHAPVVPLKQHRPDVAMKAKNKTYLCILMADYDSATPLYDFMPDHWSDTLRGTIPLLWGINPNLTEIYPDIIEYLYSTQSSNDYFGADASAAGYMNPNRIDKKYLPLFVEHNRKFYKQLDLTLSPMGLDWDEPTAEVKDAFTEFSHDGFAAIVLDLHDTGGKPPAPHVWKGMPVMELINSACNYGSPEQESDAVSGSIPSQSPGKPGFYLFRIVWTGPARVIEMIEVLKKKRPELDIEIVDPYNFFRMFGEYYADKTGHN
jgi:hypothetical protein